MLALAGWSSEVLVPAFDAANCDDGPRDEQDHEQHDQRDQRQRPGAAAAGAVVLRAVAGAVRPVRVGGPAAGGSRASPARRRPGRPSSIVSKPGACDGSTVVAPSVCIAIVGAATPAGSTAGTAEAAASTSPRRSACAARASSAAVVGRSDGAFAMHAMTRRRIGSGTVVRQVGRRCR